MARSITITIFCGLPRFWAQWTERERLRRARRILRGKGCRKTILYIWQPRYQSALDLITYHLSCYHIDDEYTFSEVDKPISDQERQLIERVDQVFIHSPALLEKKGKLNPQTAFVPNGADYEAYAASRQEPSDLVRIPGPRIGYTGRIKPQLVWPLIARLMSQHPEWSFVLVGPQTSHREIRRIVQELSKYRNVYFLGAKSVQELSAYPQYFDVCIMPYQLNDYTKYIYPVKLHEYLASGRPVVGTPLRSLAEFGNVIKLVRTADEWSKALRDSLCPAATSCEQVEARRNIARHHDWNRLVRLIAHTMCERLGPLYLERLQKISAVSDAAFAN
jgi:glycosyltransferase involved in cell wall biosynthesis